MHGALLMIIKCGVQLWLWQLGWGFLISERMSQMKYVDTVKIHVSISFYQKSFLGVHFIMILRVHSNLCSFSGSYTPRKHIDEDSINLYN
jgi:hypothetical protein